MALFGGKKKKDDEYKKVSLQDIPIPEPVDNPMPPPPEEVEEKPMVDEKTIQNVVEESVELLEEKLAIAKQKAEEKQQREQPEDLPKPQMIIRDRAVPVENMFNNISDRIDGIETFLVQLHGYLKTKFKE